MIRWLRSHPLTGFVVLAYTGSWIFWVPFIPLQKFIPAESYKSAAAGGGQLALLAGPFLASLIMTRLTTGSLRAWTSSFKRWRVPPVSYALALIAIPAAIMTASAVLPGKEAGTPSFVGPAVVIGPLIQGVVFLIGGPIQEEVGWRGFALPVLQERIPPLRAAVVLGSACVSDVTALEAAGTELRASKLVLSGSWSTTAGVASGGNAPIIAVRPGIAEVAATEGAPLTAEALEVPVSAEAAAVRLVSREATSVASGPALSEARTVVVGGRGVDGDFDLVRSLAQPLDAAVGATRVACDEGWIERSAQIGQTGETISPRLYIGLGVSGAVHHTSGIQGAGTVVAICDDSEAPIFEMADFGVVGDVTEVVPQLVEELARLRG